MHSPAKSILRILQQPRRWNIPSQAILSLTPLLHGPFFTHRGRKFRKTCASRGPGYIFFASSYSLSSCLPWDRRFLRSPTSRANIFVRKNCRIIYIPFRNLSWVRRSRCSLSFYCFSTSRFPFFQEDLSGIRSNGESLFPPRQVFPSSSPPSRGFTFSPERLFRC